MKKIAHIAVVAAFAVVPFIGGDSALAAGTCQVGYTGPNSNNECTLTTTYTCTVKNENDFDIVNENNQVVGSGTATSSGNTNGGGATSGSATNSNGTNINVNITNGDSGKLCTVVTTVPATPTQPEPQPEVPTGGMGSVSPVVKETVQAPQKAAPAVLPMTSGDKLTAAFVVAVSLMAIGAIAARLAVATYGRLKS